MSADERLEFQILKVLNSDLYKELYPYRYIPQVRKKFLWWGWWDSISHGPYREYEAEAEIWRYKQDVKYKDGIVEVIAVKSKGE